MSDELFLLHRGGKLAQQGQLLDIAIECLDRLEDITPDPWDKGLLELTDLARRKMKLAKKRLEKEASQMVKDCKEGSESDE